ncbi:hypothetical protein GCM10009780_43780 [Actinomadura alba]
MTDGLKLPSGITLPVASGQTAEQVLWLHQFTSLSEGVCPLCSTRLTEAQADSAQTPGTGRPWLYCAGCPCYWQVDVHARDLRWEAWWAWEGRAPSLF